MVQRSQPVADRPEERRSNPAARRPARPWAGSPRSRPSAPRARRCARRSPSSRSRSRELLAERFPFVAAPARSGAPAAPIGAAAGPSMPGLGELERTRDRLAARLEELRARAARRSEHERGARSCSSGCASNRAGTSYYRVPVRDLGGTGCGVYEVRPRHGPDRDARGLVAAHAVIRLSVRAGAAQARGPGSGPRGDRRRAAPERGPGAQTVSRVSLRNGTPPGAENARPRCGAASIAASVRR